MIEVTEFAIKKFSEFAEDDGHEKIVRAKVQGGGCAGFTYDLSFINAEEISESDEKFGNDEVVIVIDQMSLQYLDGSTIDYHEDKLGTSGFKFVNPNTTGSCGCGNSFSL
jgi:iron-sulfur cluster assembly accessory protein